MAKLLSRDEFKRAVFARDQQRCIFCDLPAVDAHHIIERRLWSDGGYYLANGASVCSEHHRQCETTEIGTTQIYQVCGISERLLPAHLYTDQVYDKWGNPVLKNGKRLRGELFYQENEFIGFTGLYGPTTDFTIEPSIEVAWRFATQYWGKGYATEAASAVIAFGFEQMNLAEIIAFTAVVNVMQRLGMQYQYDFAHPDLAVHHPLSQHCLYKIKAA